jgi:PEGA domain
MRKRFWFLSVVLFLIPSCLFLATPSLSAQDSKVMGEIKFEGATGVEKDSGIWVDGEYVGYVKELKGNKKLLLLPGKHQITARQAGYSDVVLDIVVEPAEVQTIRIKMNLLPGAATPKVTSQLKLTIQPPRAAVFLDGNYVGHAGELGGSVHSLLVAPGTHHIKVELPGYRTFETDVTLLAGQKSEVKTELVKGSIEQAGSDIKKSQ